MADGDAHESARRSLGKRGSLKDDRVKIIERTASAVEAIGVQAKWLMGLEAEIEEEDSILSGSGGAAGGGQLEQEPPSKPSPMLSNFNKLLLTIAVAYAGRSYMAAQEARRRAEAEAQAARDAAGTSFIGVSVLTLVIVLIVWLRCIRSRQENAKWRRDSIARLRRANTSYPE